MQNDMRDRLVDLLDKAFLESNDNYGMPCTDQVADHLIANGVVCPPCHIGKTVYMVGLVTNQIIKSVVTGIVYTENEMLLVMENGTYLSLTQQLGKTVFLTKAQAEQKLKEMRVEK